MLFPRTRSPAAGNIRSIDTEMGKHFQLDEPSRSLMRSAINQMQLPDRVYQRGLKLFSFIADLAGEINIASQHLAEALQYRPKLDQF